MQKTNQKMFISGGMYLKVRNTKKGIRKLMKMVIDISGILLHEMD